MKVFDYLNLANPRYFKDNRMEAHSDHRYYKNEQELKGHSSFYFSLNGLWKFHYAKNQQSRIPDFEKPDYDASGWDDIRVPAHIQLEGYDKPQYSNVEYPWESHDDIKPGEIPTYFNPVASYIKYFSIPENMLGKRLFISFQGAESALALWLNGSFVGYSEDSFTPSEFELTPYVCSGENKLAVQVFKWSSGSWTEDQDFFRFSGLYRDVFLFTVPDVHAYDITVMPTVSESLNSAELKVDIDLWGSGSVEGILSKDGNIVARLYGEGSGKLSMSVSVVHPALWSAETPELYDLLLTVKNMQGETTEVIPQTVGFRRFELKNGIMHLNGKRIVFKGVNRHEFSSKTGRYVNFQELELDIKTMKRNNINAVRTSHYPNTPAIYDLCDKYGLYMIAETNMETHGTWEGQNNLPTPEYDKIIPCDHEEWKDALLDRVYSQYHWDKNHPSILIWSCGNESFGGSVIYEMSQLFRSLDSSRLVHYEGVCWDRRYNDTSDIESQMYTPACDVKAYLAEHRDKPFILCEYAHMMGNSGGALHKYTELAYEDELYQGGFIWDYIDQSLVKKDRYGKEFQAYGGDFGDRPNDGNFSGNGIVYGGDRKESPKMPEVKYDYQNIKITFNLDKKNVLIENRNLFTTTKEYSCHYTVEKEGKTLLSINLDVDIPPLTEKTYKLPELSKFLPEIAECPGEYVLTMTFLLKKDTLWASRGHEVAFGQTVLKIGSQVSLPEKYNGLSPLKVIETRNNIGIVGRHFRVLFSKLVTGGLTSYVYGGVEMLPAIPVPNFWRAPTDNDRANLMPMRYGQWKIASQYLSHKDFRTGAIHTPQVTTKEDCVEVTCTYVLPSKPATEVFLIYMIYQDGTVQVKLQYNVIPELADMPEFGVLFKLDADYHNFTWYGRGPADTYADRNHGSKLGVYTTTAQENMAAYLVPQECGNKTDVRWAEVTDYRGRGLRFEGDNMNVSVLPYTPHEIENARHPYELPEIHYTVVRCSLAQMGIAGDNTWGAQTHPEYLLKPEGTMEFTFSFKGI